MPAIHISAVSFSYTSAHTVLTGVDIHLGPGWVGVVGPNGSGKSTLLGLMSGELTPDRGTVTIESDTPVTICGQRVDELEGVVRRFAASFNPADFTLRGQLDLAPEQLERWPTLSPGERKRWQVGAALAGEPDILLLDEPTNHLDASSMSLLVAALKRFRGLGVVVSHDRSLLEDFTRATIRVDNGTAVLWGGSYAVASSEWMRAEDAEREAHEKAKRTLAKEERRLAERRRDLEERNSAFNKRMRGAAAKDHDTHSTSRKEKHRKGEASSGSALRAANSRRDRLAGVVEEHRQSRPVGRSVTFEGERAPRRQLVRLHGDIRAGDRVLLRDLDLGLARTDRIHLRGPNGSGKSTVLGELTKAWNLPRERLGLLTQEMTVSDGKSLLDSVLTLPRAVRGRVFQLVAALGVDPDVLLASASPSPGEARKLALSFGLAAETWLLLLDEPTNHFDLPALERMEQALESYPGAVVVVSHDKRFAARNTGKVWSIDPSRQTLTVI